MSQHYTLNTVEASEWCRRCGKATMHRIDNRQVGPCLVCLQRPTRPAPTKTPTPESGELFAAERTLKPK